MANANAMAQQVAALMSMGGAYGSDPTAMLQAAAIQQQLLMYGGGEYIFIIFKKMGESPGGANLQELFGHPWAIFGLSVTS